VPIDTFYGNPDDSHVRATAGLASAMVEHRFAGFNLRNRTLYGDYDRFYQNYVPGAANADASKVALTAYNNATERRNLFNQTDATWSASTGAVRHTLLAGVELGRQRTENFRNTGYFESGLTTVLVPFEQPTISTRATFRQSATDADNHLQADISAVYAQDQIEITPHLELLAGVRFDRFDLTFDNDRNGDRITRLDDLVSPRFGLVVKPTERLSFYGSYSVSHLPGSGDQFSSLTAVTKLLEPEHFRNYEVGAKWGAAAGLELSAAVYRLDRTNTRSTDPNDPTRVVQTGSQRSNGFELGASGQVTSAWSVAGGYAYQDTFVTSPTVTAREGATGAQVPKHTLSLWNNLQIRPRLGAALGVIYRSEVFATIDNTVTLPGYTRLDAAGYWQLTDGIRLQVNVENLLDTDYWANADSNTNLSPGSPRALRLGMIARF
jgi:catecholate siderophore receptor